MRNGNPHGLHAARCGSATFGRTLSKKGEAEFGQGGRTIQVSEERERTSLINKMAIAMYRWLSQKYSIRGHFCSVIRIFLDNHPEKVAITEKKYRRKEFLL